MNEVKYVCNLTFERLKVFRLYNVQYFKHFKRIFYFDIYGLNKVSCRSYSSARELKWISIQYTVYKIIVQTPSWSLRQSDAVSTPLQQFY